MPPPPPIPPDEPAWPIPTFDLRVEDLSHPGFKLFLAHIDPADALTSAVQTVCALLYTHESVPTNVQNITLVLRPMPGVAHTLGSPTHKEIHLSLGYVVQAGESGRVRDEIVGVLVHEMVHCYQYNGLGLAPGGLIEGVADWVRLRAGLAPPHWKEGRGATWDAGYEATGYFLEWMERRYGAGTVLELNARMKDREYDEIIFKETTGRGVAKLWDMYREHLPEQPSP